MLQSASHRELDPGSTAGSEGRVLVNRVSCRSGKCIYHPPLQQVPRKERNTFASRDEYNLSALHSRT
ncbi:hypothetical protein Y1Q_0007926 [Alligator mississippiensis]|uniref:Uncharacterized protein n=1 Tax=Alligator mississippiensis TaxID=8496 RepID=A0A151NEW7_ALLMI|nr:hypothetical protein Y1Q_0007926 [Alligator mississippiensis]